MKRYPWEWRADWLNLCDGWLVYDWRLLRHDRALPARRDIPILPPALAARLLRRAGRCHDAGCDDARRWIAKHSKEVEP